MEQIAAATLDVTETATELQRQSAEFDRLLKGLDANGQPIDQPPYPHGDDREPFSIAMQQGEETGDAVNLVEPIPATAEQRTEPQEETP